MEQAAKEPEEISPDFEQPRQPHCVSTCLCRVDGDTGIIEWVCGEYPGGLELPPAVDVEPSLEWVERFGSDEGDCQKTGQQEFCYHSVLCGLKITDNTWGKWFYTVFHPLVVEVSCVWFLTQPACIVQKKHRKHLPQADERLCTPYFVPLA